MIFLKFREDNILKAETMTKKLNPQVIFYF